MTSGRNRNAHGLKYFTYDNKAANIWERVLRSTIQSFYTKTFVIQSISCH